jgi:tetratricopeptide (TPR) repeat protein
MQQEPKWAAQIRSTLSDYFAQVRFARAAELARSCRYLEAEALLSPGGELPCDPKEIDLLARIAALQKDYNRAEELWQKALAISPGRESFPEALAALERVRGQKEVQRAFYRELRKGFLFLLLLAAVTALAVALTSGLR